MNIKRQEGKKMAEDKAKKLAEKQQAKEAKKAARLQNRDKLRAEMEERKAQLKHDKKEMGAALKKLLASEIKVYEKQEKRRSAEIISVFAKHNFYANGFSPEELRTTLEDLGPTYVKIGQIMSSRVDLLPESYCKELEKLRANVKELDPAIARAVIEEETGKKIEEIYKEFRDKPLGSASIGQAHYGVLKDGTKVVTKVQRPLIADMMRKDFVLLKKIGKALNVVSEGSEEDQMIDLLSVIEELERVTEEELDFRVEAENTRFFKENCVEDEEKVNCPTVYDELTTERIFTMSFVDGCSISKKEKLLEQGCDLDDLGERLVDNYIHQVLDVGTFHADPHQGNIMVANGVPYWIDFGMIGSVTQSDLSVFQNLILSVVELDAEMMVNAIMSLGATSAKTDRNKLMEDVSAMMDKYSCVTNIMDVDIGGLLGEVTDLAGKHHVTIPGRYTMLIRSIATFEGVLEQLSPSGNLFEAIANKLMDRVKQSFDMSESLKGAGKDILATGKRAAKLPALIHDVVSGVAKGRTKINIELTGYEELLKESRSTILNLVIALFACILFVGSCILATVDMSPKTRHGIPLFSAGGIVLSISMAVYVIMKMAKKKK